MEHHKTLDAVAKRLERMLVAVRAAARQGATPQNVYEQLGEVLREMTPLHEAVLAVRTETGLQAINKLPADPPAS